MEAEETPARTRGRPGPDPALIARARELRAGGLSDRAVGAEMGVSHKTVGRWLAGEEPGHGPDGKFKARDDVNPAAVARLRDEARRERGLSWREIGAELGISHETARQRYGASKEAAASDLERTQSPPPLPD
jgi:orotate phosphoribosyltransferase-like protein